jgi:glycerol-3-phosphate dehydrogenase (NAD(P)+)
MAFNRIGGRLRMANVSILGAGAWGTALALQAHAAGNKVTLWAYLAEEKEEIETFGENKTRLPGVAVPRDIQVTCDLAQAAESDILLVVTPAQVLRTFLAQLKPFLKPSSCLVFCSKGIEIATGALISEICHAIIPETETAILSGPNFAKEIALGTPGAATLAAKTLKKAAFLADILSSPTFRIYPSDDPLGAQIGGALKNVIAIAAGLVTGARLGENARAALITRGLEELVQFGLAKGARRETFMGLSGVGDLVLCCTSPTSRNMRFGMALGEGQTPENLLKEGQALAEGAYTVKAVMKLLKPLGLEMPICAAVYRILYEKSTIQAEIKTLLNRPSKCEIEPLKG